MLAARLLLLAYFLLQEVQEGRRNRTSRPVGIISPAWVLRAYSREPLSGPKKMVLSVLCPITRANSAITQYIRISVTSNI